MDRERGRPLALDRRTGPRSPAAGRSRADSSSPSSNRPRIRIASDPAGRPRSWCAPTVCRVIQGQGMALWRHRRRLTLMALGLSGLLPLVGWWQATSLSPFEREIVGEWAIPQAEVASRAGFVTASGPVTNPWMVWDFRRDRSFRVRIVSPDDPSVNIPQIEGRWRVADGELSLDDLGPGLGREGGPRTLRPEFRGALHQPDLGAPEAQDQVVRSRHARNGRPAAKSDHLEAPSNFALPKSPGPHAGGGQSTAGQAPDR